MPLSKIALTFSLALYYFFSLAGGSGGEEEEKDGGGDRCWSAPLSEQQLFYEVGQEEEDVCLRLQEAWPTPDKAWPRTEKAWQPKFEGVWPEQREEKEEEEVVIPRAVSRASLSPAQSHRSRKSDLRCKYILYLKQCCGSGTFAWIRNYCSGSSTK